MLPAVTIVTATWGRPKTIIERAIPSLRGQDYPGPVEHLVITDGFDRHLNNILDGAGYNAYNPQRRLVWLGKNWSAPEVVHGGVGVIPRMIGSWMAAGDYVGYLDDDNEYLPHHISTLVAALEDSGAGFATSRWKDGGPGGPPAGDTPPGRGRTDTNGIMHRASIVPKGTWEHHDGYENDGALTERWLAAGISHVFVPEPTYILYPHRHGDPDPATDPWPGE